MMGMTSHDETNKDLSSTVSTRKMEDVRVGDWVLAARKRPVSSSTPLLSKVSQKSGVVFEPLLSEDSQKSGVLIDQPREEFEYVYAEVVYLPHGIDNQEFVTYLQLTTESGRDLKMTKNHLMPVGNCDDFTDFTQGSKAPPPPLRLRAASDIVVGDCVLSIAGHDKVVSIHTIEGKGVYTIITTEV